ncbi:MAG: ABC transporter ATP-binding protein [Candidatus Saccharibacteria bacterium]|nr:ABC transporter ATP-binding protein [Candidatus Saccharibacteria bacterium]
MSNFAIDIDDLSVQNKQKILLGSVSFRIERGAIIGLLGPSGAGKTTLLRTIMGIQIQTAGKVKVLGRNAGDKANRSRIGYVTQAPSVYSDLTVAQNLSYFATLIGVDKKAVTAAIKKVHLQGKDKQLVATLSGGERTRVSLAVALLGDPELLVLDEPTVGLDPILRRDLWKLFSEMARGGKTLIISSHVMDEAEHCEQLLLVRDGVLLWNENKDKLLNTTKKTNVEDAFIKLMEDEK